MYELTSGSLVEEQSVGIASDGRVIRIHAYTDAHSLFQSLSVGETDGASSSHDKRLRISLISLREFYQYEGNKIDLSWVPTSLMLADELTKCGVKTGLLNKASAASR
eukprot:1738805-Amphidinium_carterae.1